MPNKIKLYATGFEIEVPDNFHYHDDGVVESVIGHTSELCGRYKKYNYDSLLKRTLAKVISESYLIKLPNALRPVLNSGRVVKFCDQKYASFKEALNDNAEVNVHSFVLKSNEKNEINNRGHEEYHVVLDNEGPDPLQEALETVGIKTEGFGQLPTEAKCDLSGLYSLLKKYPNETYPNLLINSDTKEILLKWLEKNSNLRGK